MDIRVSVTENVLTNILVVLERIFKCMNIRQLNKCSLVCKSWRDQVRREKCRREKYFPKLRWNSFKHEGDVNSIEESWWNSIRDFIMDSPVEPACLLMFCTETLWCCMNKLQSPGQSLQSLLNIDLPSSCIFQLVVTDGVVGTDQDMKTEEMEEYISAMSLLMIRKSAGAKFLQFSSSLTDCKQLVKHAQGKLPSLPICFQGLNQKEVLPLVKMINLYCPMSGINQETSNSFYKLFNKPLIAGGFVNEKILSDLSGVLQRSEEGCAVLGFVICGERVKVASVLIPSDVQDEKQVDALIKQLSDSKFPLENSFGLMYACVGRGVHVYTEHNVESKVFRKYFPKTPLLGIFGNGEIGMSYPPKDFDDTPPKLLHAYTTIMCLVCLT
uniref:FIST C-domain domain-containing protein n=1 Tax=Biomphalaria glabrata TaxID=6526 RepID=A0A2C9KFM9_BIOGL